MQQTTSNVSVERATGGYQYLIIPMFMENSTRDSALFIFKVIIYPIIGIVGITGNIISGVVLKKTGLNQPSNIFLLALSVADSMCLVWALDVTAIISQVHGIVPGVFNVWEFSYATARVLFYIFVSILVVSRFGQRVSATLTVVIGFERLIAVFFPLKFVTIVTVKRAWLIVAGTVLFWLPWSIFVFFWYKLAPLMLTTRAIVLQPRNSELYRAVDSINVNVVNHLTHTIPLALVTASCIVLAVKVTITRRRREKLVSSTATQKTSSSSRTSITLLLVCSVYSISRFVYILENLHVFDDTDIYWRNLAIVYFVARDALMFINSACNFFIYVVFNPKFRKSLTTLMCVNSPAKKE